MSSRYILSIALLFLIAGAAKLKGQGCVAIRQFSTCSGNSLESNLLGAGEWQIGLNFRHFKSFRHFRGTHEEPDRVANGTEVVNYSQGLDLNLSWGITDRWFAAFTLPFVMNERSSLYEHGRTERHNTFSRGLADVRLGAGYWLFASEKHPGGNVALGLGVKLPTGNYNASDIFYNVGANGEPQVRPVDQSIQPGDGGFGITADFQVYRRLTSRLLFFGAGFYLCNPRETNGIRTFRETLNPILANESIMSVPDQYSLRGGFNYSLFDHSAGLYLGARYEGIPVEDLLGGSDGFRRPGSVLSIEPGLSYMSDNLAFNLSVPVALFRNRPQSVTDRETEQITGEPRNGDAAFADYLVTFGLAYRLGKSHKSTVFPHLDMKE